MEREKLIHDWNVGGSCPPKPPQAIHLNDETLRDGLQSPSAKTPSIEDMVTHLHNCAAVGIHALNIGLPGAGPHVEKQVERLAREIRDNKLPLKPNCAARTVKADIEPIARVVQKTGVPIEAATFIGSSAIRMEVEGWDLDFLLKCVRDAITLVKREGLPSMFVTEDTVRATPEVIEALYGTAIDLGADRIVVCDTTGHIAPWGVSNLLGFIFKLLERKGARGKVQVDWHGHMDRGLGVMNNIEAIRCGVDRIHGTALGIGERAGNAPLDLTMVNLKLMGWIGNDLTGLGRYVRHASAICGFEIPSTYPVFGSDAFETATGVHAAAVIKALRRNDGWLANRVYSGVPADEFGLAQRILVGPMSGKSNVIFWLEAHGYDTAERTVDAIFKAAKDSKRNLTDEEIEAIVSKA
ncbi:MAG: 2-isopropylmalate synthase [Planctomycetes bacterium]|nr:2-isopropylmalate synthase [Planctomycetota bacterium]